MFSVLIWMDGWLVGRYKTWLFFLFFPKCSVHCFSIKGRPLHWGRAVFIACIVKHVFYLPYNPNLPGALTSFFFPPPNSFPFQAIRPTVFCFFQGCCLIGWPRLWLKLWDRSPTCCVFHSVASLRWKVCCWSCWGILPLQWLQSSVYGAASRHLKLCIENKGLLETTQ